MSPVTAELPFPARGVCWSTNPDPTLTDSHTVNGTGMGVFISDITGLTSGVTYHVRAYATNVNGTAYGNDLAFTEGSVSPTVSTDSAVRITSTTAESGGDVSGDGGASVLARGVCWSTNPNPTVSGSHTNDGQGTGTFRSDLTDLQPETHYHIRAYARNSAGTGYGEEVAFNTSSSAPTITAFTPGSGGKGTAVIITGTNFNGVNAVRFGGTDAERFQVDSSTRITAIAGDGTSGYITVITTGGTATSTDIFIFSAVPVSVPSMNMWGLMGLSFLLAGIGYLNLRKRYAA